MNVSSAQQASASHSGSIKRRSMQAISYLFCGMKIYTSVKEQETDDRHIRIRRENSVIDSMGCNLLPESNRRQIRQLPKSHSIQSVISGETTQEDINEMVSQCMAINCEAYYRRCCLLDELIASDVPADDIFMATMNSGPMYSTDCYKYVTSYVNRFKKYSLVKNTVLNKLQEKIITVRCPPMDIYEQVPFMNVLAGLQYVVSEGGKATEALLALKHKFSIIDCVMLCKMAYYEAIMLLMGEENFNSVFARAGSRPFLICNRLLVSLGDFLLRSTVPENEKSTQKNIPLLTIKKGTIYYFKNHKDYLIKHPFGISQGVNTMLVNKVDECFYFTAFGFPGCGLDYHEISKALVISFNLPVVNYSKKRVLCSKVKGSAGEGCDKSKNKTITLDEFYANKGGLVIGSEIYLDINKIKKIFGFLFLMSATATEVVDKSAGL